MVTFCLLQLVVPAVTPALHGLFALDGLVHSAEPEDKEAGVFPWGDKEGAGGDGREDQKSGLRRKATATEPGAEVF